MHFCTSSKMRNVTLVTSNVSCDSIWSERNAAVWFSSHLLDGVIHGSEGWLLVVVINAAAAVEDVNTALFSGDAVAAVHTVIRTIVPVTLDQQQTLWDTHRQNQWETQHRSNSAGFSSINVTIDHKNSLKGLFLFIEIYASSESWINNLSIDVWFVMIGQFLKIWNLREQKI